jgi:magnesium transporter
VYHRVVPRKRKPPPGARPGAMAIPADSPRPVIHAVEYGPDRIDEREVRDASDLASIRDRGARGWIDVQGFGDEALLRTIGETFAVHPLALADVVNAPQRPKTEVYEGFLLFVGQMVRASGRHEVSLEQVSMIIGPRVVLTFQERADGRDCFDPVRARLRSGAGLMRTLGPDYLAYALIDVLVDAYYPVVEALGDALDELEDEVIARPRRDALARLTAVRRSLLLLHRTIWPQREAISSLLRDGGTLVEEPVRPYLRDCLDHAFQIIDVVETHREMAVGIMDIYMSSVSNRMNEVMKVLTVLASIFIPLTFIVGIYGMNFENMPELRSRWGYPAVWVVMVAVAVGMLVHFRRRGWIEPAEGGRDGGMSRRIVRPIADRDISESDYSN